MFAKHWPTHQVIWGEEPWVSTHISAPGSCKIKYLLHHRLTDNTQLPPKTPKGPLTNLRDQIVGFEHEANDLKSNQEKV